TGTVFTLRGGLTRMRVCPREPGSETMENNLGLLLSKRAFLNPDREAYVDSHSDLRLSYAQLNERSNRLASALRQDGIGKGERVGLLLMNSAEFMEAYFALAKAGAV